MADKQGREQGEPLLRITRRRRLPHWHLQGSTYFVTFRVAQGQLTLDERALVLEHLKRGAGKHYDLFAAVVMPDHVHLFINFPPTTAPTYVFAVLKAKTASALFRNFPWLRTYFRKGHFWSPGKFYRSVGNVTSDVIQNYIKYSQGSWKTNFSDLPSYYQQQKLHSFVA